MKLTAENLRNMQSNLFTIDDDLGETIKRIPNEYAYVVFIAANTVLESLAVMVEEAEEEELTAFELRELEAQEKGGGE